MGCDIHMFREVRREGKWECLERAYEEPHWDSEAENTMTCLEDLAISRNYWLFGLLAAGVRTKWGFSWERTKWEFSWEPRGLPNDVSDPVDADHTRWDSDAHIASWLGLTEIQQKATELLILPGQEASQCGKLLTDLMNQLEWPEGVGPGDCRIVFWFDN